MKFFHKVNKKSLKDSFYILNDFTGKFPKMMIDHVNLYELAKSYEEKGRKVEEKDLIVAYLLMDCMRVLNEKSVEKVMIDLNDIKNIMVKRKDDIWKMNIYKEKERAYLQLKHQFTIQENGASDTVQQEEETPAE